MLQADPDMIRSLRCIILILEVATGLKVNLGKTTLSPVGEVHNIEEVAVILGCTIIPLSITYLGLPPRAQASSKAIWNPILEQMRGKLSNWKGRCLSKGGKVVL